jgi:hypothetical protein
VKEKPNMPKKVNTGSAKLPLPIATQLYWKRKVKTNSRMPVVSKVFEKLLLKRLLPMVENNRLIPNHQFDFRQGHSTIELTHQIVQRINDALENKQYCAAAFLDISQPTVRQSMAYWTSVQLKMVTPSELFPYPKILFT